MSGLQLAGGAVGVEYLLPARAGGIHRHGLAGQDCFDLYNGADMAVRFGSADTPVAVAAVGDVEDRPVAGRRVDGASQFPGPVLHIAEAGFGEAQLPAGAGDLDGLGGIAIQHREGEGLCLSGVADADVKRLGTQRIISGHSLAAPVVGGASLQQLKIHPRLPDAVVGRLLNGQIRKLRRLVLRNIDRRLFLLLHLWKRGRRRRRRRRG